MGFPEALARLPPFDRPRPVRLGRLATPAVQTLLLILALVLAAPEWNVMDSCRSAADCRSHGFAVSGFDTGLVAEILALAALGNALGWVNAFGARGVSLAAGALAVWGLAASLALARVAVDRANPWLGAVGATEVGWAAALGAGAVVAAVAVLLYVPRPRPSPGQWTALALLVGGTAAAFGPLWSEGVPRTPVYGIDSPLSWFLAGLVPAVVVVLAVTRDTGSRFLMASLLMAGAVVYATLALFQATVTVFGPPTNLAWGTVASCAAVLAGAIAWLPSAWAPAPPDDPTTESAPAA